MNQNKKQYSNAKGQCENRDSREKKPPSEQKMVCRKLFLLTISLTALLIYRILP